MAGILSLQIEEVRKMALREPGVIATGVSALAESHFVVGSCGELE